MLITYERARAESLGFTARGGLMERAERMVLLGVGLAFDILVPVLWIMLVLTAFTAVQRFVKVWRQATPERAAPRPAPARRRATDEARGRDAWRSGGRHAGRGTERARPAVRVTSSLTRRDPTVRDPIQRAPYLAYRAGAEVARVVPGAGRRARWPAASRSSSALGVHAHAASRQVERNLRACPRTRLRRRSPCNAPSPPPSTPTGATATSCSGSRARRSGGSTRTSHVDRLRAHRGRRRRGQRAWCSRCRTSATGTSPARGSRGQGYTVTVVAEPLEPPELFEWFVDDARTRSGCA